MNNLFLSNIPHQELPPPSADDKKEKINFKKLKSNTINSLNEVEYFLNDFKKIRNYLKLYKILK